MVKVAPLAVSLSTAKVTACRLSEFNAKLPVVLHELAVSTTLLTLGIKFSNYAQRLVSTEPVIFRRSGTTET